MKPHDTTKDNLKILHLSLKKSANVRKYKNDNCVKKTGSIPNSLSNWG